MSSKLKLDMASSIGIKTGAIIDVTFFTSAETSSSPEFVSAGMAYIANWKCHVCSNEWPAHVYSRSAGKGCNVCAKAVRAKARHDAAVEKNSFFEKHPELIKEWDPVLNTVDIHDVSSGCTDLFHWICSECGSPFVASMSHRCGSSHSGCKNCARERVRRAACRAVINLDTGEIFESLDAAGKSCGGNLKNITNAIGRPNHMAYGYHWDYVDGKGPRQKRKQLIHNIDTDEVFPSFQAAANAYHCDRSSVAVACRTKGLCQNFHWEVIPLD